MRSPDDPIRERKHRLPPQAYRGHVAVSFTINTKDRRRWFEDGKVRAVAVAALEEAFHRNGGHAAVFVFMPDHVHLIVSGKDHGSDLLRLVAEFKQKTCFRLRKEGMQFAWQKDFYDHLIRANEDYAAHVRYVLRNPVRRGLCLRWEDWPHKGVLGQSWQDLALNTATC